MIPTATATLIRDYDPVDFGHRLSPEKLAAVPAPDIPPPGDPAVAAQLLHHILAGDVLGHGPRGEVFLLVRLDDFWWERLCEWGAAVEDGEPDAEGEPSLLTWNCAIVDGEEGPGPSPETIESARKRWRDRGMPSTSVIAPTLRGDQKRWRRILRRAGR